VSEAIGIFRALADPTRLAVFEFLAKQELSVSELTSRFAVSQPAISQHLAALRASGLVSHRKAGREVYYRADPEGIHPLFRWIDIHRAFWRERAPRLKTVLKEMKDSEQVD
jgi:DNA-binding transcriptional ArsR family regulator